MNRRQAGFLAVGVLVVAVAIVIVGGLVRHARTPSLEQQASISAPASRDTQDTARRGTDKAPASAAQESAKLQANAASAPAKADQAPAVNGPKAAAKTGNADQAPSPAPSKATSDTGQSSAADDDAASLGAVGPNASDSEGAAPGSARDATAAGEPAVPTFDVLRVEPDGSTVIAGRAEPNARVDVMSGDRTISSTEAGEAGAFVTVLDKPLPPGNYELTLQAVGKKGAKVSREVATVSVPKDKGGDLLAMVSRPGEASRIITAPKPVTGKQEHTAAGNAEPNSAGPDSQGPTVTGNAAAEAGKPGDGGSAAGAGGTKTAALPTSNEADAAAPSAGPGTASAQPDAAGVRVDAVEVEGDGLYVAGAAKPGATVRVYADNALVGEDRAGDEGRYVVNGTMPLSVGRHTIRADLVDPETGKVIVRANVPFDRPEGDQLAAVSPREAEARSQAGGARHAATVPSPLAELGAEAQSAVSDLKHKIEAKTPQPAEIEAARRKAEQSLKALASSGEDAEVGTANAGSESASPKPSDNSTAEADDTASASAGIENSPATAGNGETVRNKARDALAMLKSLPDIAPDLPLDQAQLDAIRSKVADVSKAVDALPTPPEPAPVVATAGGENGPRTIEQQPLTPTDGFVIIRRGDTLWQIARRQYGHGVRYTTIYLANSDQISDPNLILPGQVFDVPQKSEKPYGEVLKMHRELMRKEHRG